MALTKIGATLGGSADIITVTQTRHGFVSNDRGKAVKMTNISGTPRYMLATANSTTNADAIAIIIAVIDANTISLALSGRITVDACVPNEVAGTVLFLPTASTLGTAMGGSNSGHLTSTEPSGNNEVSKPMAVITIANSEMVMLAYRGEVISTAGITLADGSVDNDAMADNAINTDEIVDDAVTADKLANSINAEIAANTAKTGITTSQANAITANTAKVTNATHSGDVTGATTLTIANGAVDIAHLSASGTKDETTVLHGNNTFATVSAGITGHGTVVIKSSDQTVNNSTTLVNDDTLVWALAANKNYRLWAHAFIDTHIHSDFKWTFTGPSGCEIHLTVNRNYAAGASYDWHGLNSLGTAVSMNTPTDTASNWYWFGTIMNGGNAGNLQLQWAQNAAQSFDTKMHNGSWGIVELLN